MKKVIVIYVFFLPLFVTAQVNIIPQPVEIKKLRAPNLQLDNEFVIYYRQIDLKDEAENLKENLNRVSSLNPVVKPFEPEKGKEEEIPEKVIFLSLTSDDLLPAEGYSMEIIPGKIIIKGSEAGVFYGAHSLIQMVSHSPELSLAPMIITDYPRFPWRGMHLDVSRHFFPVTFIKKYIDVLAMHKMNVFHWHLTDDQGWRIEIKKYPKLTSVGGWRKNSMIGHYNENKFDNEKHGGYYTQEEIKEIVNYANSRYVTIVPEIEMPGHSMAALAAYPQFSCTGGPFEVATKWGVFDDVYCAGNDSTFLFMQDILTEVMQLFPGEYIHIGGDECPKERWKKCSKCQKRIKDEKLKDEHELQSYFIQRIEKFVNSKGKKIIGWDEILEGGLAPNASVMSWRGTEGGVKAAREKHTVVMTPGSHCYFDHYQGNPRNEPVAIGGFTTVEKVYSYEPVPEELNEEEAKYILGAQGNVWTEYITTTEHVEYMALPRLCALSEVLWSPKENRNEESFLKRLEKHFELLQDLDVNFSTAMFDVKYKMVPTQGGVKIELDSSAWDVVYWAEMNREGTESFGNMIMRDTIKNGKGFIEVFSNSTLVMHYDHPLSRPAKINFYCSKSTSKTITYKDPPARMYNTDANFTLVNGVKGTLPQNNSEWLGWSGTDVEITIDLGKKMEISEVVINALEDHHNWIWLPEGIYFHFSKNGKKWKGDSRTAYKGGLKWENRRSFTASFKSKKVRYVKIYLRNAGKINPGNPGEGSESWMFLDEIEIY
ncbi:MAG: family 20 glycosylhydrolase [Bacteroidota bacterium]